jgi:hypothetical protein
VRCTRGLPVPDKLLTARSYGRFMFKHTNTRKSVLGVACAALAATALAAGALAATHHEHNAFHQPSTSKPRHHEPRSKPKSEATSSGPRLLVTMTEKERNSFWDEYVDCISAHTNSNDSGSSDAPKAMPVTDIGSPAAQRACADLKPYGPTALNPDRNPNYARDMTAWVECMNGRDLRVVETAGGPTAGGWTYGTATTPRERFLLSPAGWHESQEIEHSCQVEAFADDDGQ